MADLETHEIISQRKEKLFQLIKKRFDFGIYILLAFIVYIGVWIRTRNLPGLRDITTGGWTLGPDLDPFLFLRYAKYIVENGSLFALDTMRYVPFGMETGDFTFHYYSIAWFHKLASIFGSGSVEQSAAIFPVFMFAFTIIGFFLLSREVIGSHFDKNYSNVGALISTLIFSLFPMFIPRSIAGIPEKESSAFLFMFFALYFFIKSWNGSDTKNRISLGVVAGISTALMALTWGAYSYIFYIILPSTFICFLIGNFEKKQIISYGSWIIPSAMIMAFFSNRYGLNTIFTSFDRGVAIALLSGVCFYHFLYPKFEKSISKNKYLSKIPSRLLATLLFGFVLIFLISLTLGPKFILERLTEIYFNFVRPATSRLIQTVAENRQPYFVEWVGNFGPKMGNFFVSFWLSFIGSIIIFWNMLKKFQKKDRAIFTLFFSFMIFSVVFSRYSSNSLFNGQSAISLMLYGGGMLAFIVWGITSYYRSEKNQDLDKFSNMKIELIMFFLFFFVALISSRGFIRLVMILVPPASIAIGYLGALSVYSLKSKIDYKKNIIYLIFSLILIILILITAYSFYNSSKNLATNYVPSGYTHQWQKAMSWVRDNTPENSVFGHWWDYGYWIQSIGERATVLDGGNAISYWNHLMGRYALTESNLNNTFDFLYAHNATHFLIDSTDIGKYSAFSTIGSDADYDRRSWIPTFLKDNSQTTERKNTTLFVYPGGTLLDQDINYKLNGSDIFLPEGKAYLAAVITSVDEKSLVSEVTGVYFFQGKTYQIPLRYYWDKKTGLVDNKKGIDSGVLLYPRVVQNSGGGGDVDPRGAIIYLSQRVVNTNLARFYLYGEENPNFKLVHSEQDQIVEILKNQGLDVGDFVYFNEFRGPIKIWNINYPKDVSLKESYLETVYPDSIRLG